MQNESIHWGWIVLTAICFAVGFGASWYRMRKRVMQRYQVVIEQELKKRIREEIVKRVTQGPEVPNKDDSDASGKPSEK